MQCRYYAFVVYSKHFSVFSLPRRRHMICPVNEQISQQQIAERFREGREDRNLSQAALGRALGVTRDQIANVETGRAVLGWDLGRRYCEFLNVSQRWLATGSEPAFPFVRLPDELPWPVQGFVPDGSFSQMYHQVLGPFCEAFFHGGLDGVTRQLKRIAYARPLGQRGAGTVKEEARSLEQAINELVRNLVRAVPPSLYVQLFDAFREICVTFIQAHAARIVSENAEMGRSAAEGARASESAMPSQQRPRTLSEGLTDSSAAYAQKPDAHGAVKVGGTISKNNLTSYSPSASVSPAMTKAITSWPELRERLLALTSVRGAKAALARKFNVTTSAVSEWMRGLSMPSADTTIRLLHWVAEGGSLERKGAGATTPAPKTHTKGMKHEQSKSRRTGQRTH